MPTRAKSPCLEPGCSKLVDRGRCPLHTKERNTEVYANRNADPVSKLYRTVAWVRFRSWFLRKYPVCQRVIDGIRCFRPASLVHHSISPRQDASGFLSEE